MLPSLAVRAGLEPVRAETWSFPCGTIADTYPHTPLLEYGDHAHADGAVTKEDAAQWRKLLEERERDGSFAACFAVRADVLRKPE